LVAALIAGIVNNVHANALMVLSALATEPYKGVYIGLSTNSDNMAVMNMTPADTLEFFKNNGEYDCKTDAEAKEHYNCVFGVKPGCGHGVHPRQKGVKYSDVLGSGSSLQACRQQAITGTHATLHKELMEAYAKNPSRKLRNLLEVYNPGEKSYFLILGVIGVATGLTDPDGNALVFDDLEGTNGFKSAVEGQISQSLVEATDWELRVNGCRSGPIVTCFPHHLPEGIIEPLKSSGESEVLGPWTNYVDQDKTNFENLCDVVLLYLESATKWLETEYDTNFDTMAEVDPVKRRPQADVRRRSGRRT
jgi:hypothetical protein